MESTTSNDSSGKEARNRLVALRPDPRSWRLVLLLLGVFLLASIAFIWFQPVYSDASNPRPFPSAAWWFYPYENNAYKHLSVVPFASSGHCYFTNKLGWIGCDGGVILHTDDGGKTWSLQTNIDWGTVSKGIHQPGPNETQTDERRVSGLGDNTTVRRGPQNLRVVQFIDQQHGWIVGAMGTILYTDNGGETWNAQQIDSSASLESVNFVDMQEGWIVGEHGTILHTTNGGRDWESQFTPQEKSNIWFRSVKFINAREGWISGAQGTILHTENGGKSWNPQDPPKLYSWLQCVTFLDSNLGWAAGQYGVLLCSVDGGKNWTRRNIPTNIWLDTVTFITAKRGWVSGSSGTIWTTEDGGDHWQPQATHTRSDINSLSFLDARHGWATGRGVAVLHTEDGGKTWNPQTANANAWLNAMSFVDENNGWIVGGEGTILHTEDGGTHWTSQTSPKKVLLETVHFLDKSDGWSAGEAGTILHTEDGGTTWGAQSANSDVWFRSISFVNQKTGWVVGQLGTICNTTDGGRTWTPQNSTVSGWLQCVAFLDEQHGWAVGEKGTILHTDNGGTVWTNRSSPSQVWFESISFADPLHGWIVGDAGNILYTSDGGQNWTPQTSPTKASLRSVTALDDLNARIVGWDGNILRTSDSGQTWAAQSTRGPLASVQFVTKEQGWAAGLNVILKTTDGGGQWNELQPYRRWPAPIFWFCLLLVSTLLILAFHWKHHTPIPATSIANYGVSDSPITSNDLDAINFGPLVEGIANFLQNRNTTGPLTLAVTGKWGTGKSSLMSLLKEKLEARAFRPVWFNAWHHQQENQLFAALLESIRSEAVPSLASFPGLMFRQRLIRQRLSWKWPHVMFGAIVCAAGIAIIKCFGFDLKELQNFEMLKIILFTGKLAVVGAAVLSLVNIYKNFKAFGVDPSKLLLSITGKAKVSDLGLVTSLRHRFAREFQDVTTALQPRTMTIFIDDLDRCEPAQVMRVMQSLNFLASSGRCLLIIGMEEEAVTNCVAASLKEQFAIIHGRELPEAERAKLRWENARRWMEKLIQIRVPVPNPDLEQVKTLLGRRSDTKPQEQPVSIQMLWWAWRFRKPVGATVCCLGLAIAAFTLTNYFLQKLEQSTDIRNGLALVAKQSIWPTNSFLSVTNLKNISLETPGSAAGLMLMTNTDITNWFSAQKWTAKLQFAQHPITTSNIPQQTAPAIPSLRSTGNVLYEANPRMLFAVQPGQKDHGGWEIPTICLAVFLYLLWRKAAERFDAAVEDSEDFIPILTRWAKRINANRKTPRSIKRLINKLRFYAMVTRALSPSNVSERAVVVFGILDDEDGDALDHCMSGKPSSITIDPELKGDFEEMIVAINTHPVLFHFLRSSVRFTSELASSIAKTD